MAQQNDVTMPTKYDPQSTEGKWYQYWLDGGFFKPEDDPRKSLIRL